MNILCAVNWSWIAIIGIVAVLTIVLVCMFISYYNKFVRLRVNTEESFSAMDVHLKKRYDLIPNIVSTVKGYAKHEQETLSKVIEARNMCVASTSTEEKIKNENMLNETLKTLFAVAEDYPELQANANFMDLQQQLREVEIEIANARKFYNARVKTYNTAIMVFPGILFAKLYKAKKAEFYVVEEEKERKNIKVEF